MKCVNEVQLAPPEQFCPLRTDKNENSILSHRDITVDFGTDLHDVLITSASALLHVQPQAHVAIGLGGQQRAELFDGISREGKHCRGVWNHHATPQTPIPGLVTPEKGCQPWFSAIRALM